METIEFECPYCERVSRVPLSFAGRQGKCPGCLKMLEVPDPRAAADKAPDEPAPAEVPATHDAPTVEVPAAASQIATGEAAPATHDAPSAEVPALGDAPTAAAPAAPPPAGDAARPRRKKTDRACPYCGETIKRIAKKCRYCGEFLDKQLAQTRRRGGGQLPLASPGLRLGAWAIDFVMFHLPTWAAIGAGSHVLSRTSSTEGQVVGGSLIALGILTGLFITGYNWYLIAVRGQTIGKRWLKIKVVLETGKPVNFVSGVLLRNWITGVLGSAILSWIGCLFFVIDSTMIFSQERRCLHDHIASTRVIVVKPHVPGGGSPRGIRP